MGLDGSPAWKDTLPDRDSRQKYCFWRHGGCIAIPRARTYSALSASGDIVTTPPFAVTTYESGAAPNEAAVPLMEVAAGIR